MEAHSTAARARRGGDAPADPRLSRREGSSAAQWVLERRFWEGYGRRERLELSGDGDRPIAIDAIQRLELVVQRVVAVPALAAEFDRELQRRDRGTRGRA